MPELKFTIPITPRGQKRDRIGSFGGHAHSYKDKAQSQYEIQLRQLLNQHKPAQPIDDLPITLSVSAYLPIPKSKSKCWKQSAVEGKIRPTGMPDLDNIIKNIKDVMEGIFYRNDSQIVDIFAKKMYSEYPRWDIVLEW
jgi:Holliday junction resolvase RusA-like endonuclease